MTPGDLAETERLIRTMHSGGPCLCAGCGRRIHAGHTAYELRLSDGRQLKICFECGVAASHELGWQSMFARPGQQAYGGGAKPRCA